MSIPRTASKPRRARALGGRTRGVLVRPQPSLPARPPLIWPWRRLGRAVPVWSLA